MRQVCLQRQVGVHGPSHSITVVLPLLRGVSFFGCFSPKSFGLCKLSFGALVKANILDLLCIGLDGFSMLDWIDLPHSQSSCFYSGLHLFFFFS